MRQSWDPPSGSRSGATPPCAGRPSLLAESGYAVSRLTLSALRLGDYTLRHMEKVLELEAAGEGPLLRADDGAVYYIIVGLSCRMSDPDGPGSPPSVTPDSLLKLLTFACQSRTTSLEALDAYPFEWPVPIRVVVLPDEPRRHHS